MDQPYQSTEGIVLRATPYRDYDQIVTLFTATAGLLKIICYGSRSQKSKWRSLCQPLTHVELLYREKRGEIFECRDLSLIDSQDALKQEFQYIEAACDLLQALYSTQMLGKEAPQLYALLIFYLKKIPLIEDPWILALSFRLKLLKYEGLLNCPFICQHCQLSLFRAGYFSESDWYCVEDKRGDALFFSEEELELIYLLALCQKYADLTLIVLPKELKAKILRFFQDSWNIR